MYGAQPWLSSLCASLYISSYLLHLSQWVSLPLSVSPVSWRNRLKMEGCVSCPKTEVTTAPKTMHDFLQADGHAEPPMHARASHLGVAGHRNWLLW